MPLPAAGIALTEGPGLELRDESVIRQYLGRVRRDGAAMAPNDLVGVSPSPACTFWQLDCCIRRETPRRGVSTGSASSLGICFREED
jgi:hypothetical protein